MKKELLTQKEVADYFSVVPSTVKNWRDRGLISYFQAPGSSRVLYYADEIKDFRDKNTFNGKGEKQKDTVLKKVPFISPTSDDDWRI